MTPEEHNIWAVEKNIARKLEKIESLKDDIAKLEISSHLGGFEELVELQEAQSDLRLYEIMYSSDLKLLETFKSYKEREDEKLRTING